MFVMTNETVNIWTHIIGFVYFALILLDDNIMTVPSSNGNLGDHLTFSIMDSCFMVCYLNTSVAIEIVVCLSLVHYVHV